MSTALLPGKFSFPLKVTAIHSSRRNCAGSSQKEKRKISQGRGGTNSRGIAASQLQGQG